MPASASATASRSCIPPSDPPSTTTARSAPEAGRARTPVSPCARQTVRSLMTRFVVRLILRTLATTAHASAVLAAMPPGQVTGTP